MKKSLFLILFLFLLINVFPQDVFYHISNSSIYEFLDELANMQVISINSAAKPYSRTFIANKLLEANEKKDLLNNRQQKDLAFFLKDFNKELQADKNFDKRIDLFYYKDSLFTFSVNPILGKKYFFNKNGSVYHRWNGAEAFATIGQHWGFYASLRDNHENEILSEDNFLTSRMGANYKGKNDFSEMRGGITYSWNWGSFGLIKDHFTWGNNYNGSNIFSGRTPSFAHIRLNLKPSAWFEFNYIHGWLISEVVDSTRSYWFRDGNNMTYRKVYHKKFIAANMFTFTPVKRLNLSFGNSIVYTDLDEYPAYLIPVMFYKSIDHTVNSGIDNQNSQMFFDISSRQIKNIHIYTTFFIDEVAIGRMFNPDEHSNFFSTKAGFRLINFPIQNISFTSEYTKTNALAFQHYVPALTFESNRYNMGHYLKDNAKELYFAVQYKPIRGLIIDMSYLHAQKGPDYTVQGNTGRLGLPFMDVVEWENKTITFKARYEIINDAFVFAEFINSNITGDVTTYTPSFFHGKTNTVSLGMNFGF